MTTKTHWEAVYTTKSAQAVSWYQEHAHQSLALIQGLALPSDAPMIDIGGGASTLVDDLWSAGYRNLTVLDLSAEALHIARQRLGPAAEQIQWIAADATAAALPEGQYALWHDRAVFHFLTEAADRAAYVAQAMRALRPGGHLIVATFADDGPMQCSGLPVRRYSAEQLHAEFGPGFRLVSHAREDHRTPGGNVQHFVYCHCIKT